MRRYDITDLPRWKVGILTSVLAELPEHTRVFEVIDRNGTRVTMMPLYTTPQEFLAWYHWEVTGK